jgi:hypothetical protein
LRKSTVKTLKNPEINKLKLFWIAMGGDKDIAYVNGKNVLALFDKYGIKYKTNTYPQVILLLHGGITSMNLPHCYFDRLYQYFTSYRPLFLGTKIKYSPRL